MFETGWAGQPHVIPHTRTLSVCDTIIMSYSNFSLRAVFPPWDLWIRQTFGMVRSVRLEKSFFVYFQVLLYAVAQINIVSVCSTMFYDQSACSISIFIFEVHPCWWSVHVHEFVNFSPVHLTNLLRFLLTVDVMLPFFSLRCESWFSSGRCHQKVL